MSNKAANTAVAKITENLATQAVQMVKEGINSMIHSIKERFMFTMTIKDDSEVYYAFQDWFYQNYQEKFRSVTVYNVAKNADGVKVKPNSIPTYRNETSGFSFDIGYSQNSGTYVIKYNGATIQVTKGKIDGDKQAGEKNMQYYTLVSTKKEQVKSLIEEVYAKYNVEHDQIKIFVSDLYGEWRLVKRITGKTLDNIIINKDLHNTLVNDLKDFEGDKEWYASLNIPYKRGYLFYGPPGNGRIIIANNL